MCQLSHHWIRYTHHRRAGVSLGKKVLICGAGPIGLVNLLTAKAMGASEIVITDIMDNRLEVAKSMGATHTYKVTFNAWNNEAGGGGCFYWNSMACQQLSDFWQVGGKKTAEEMALDIETILGGNKPDVTIECSGVEASIRWIEVSLNTHSFPLSNLEFWPISPGCKACYYTHADFLSSPRQWYEKSTAHNRTLFRFGIFSTKSGGCLVLVGLGKPEVNMPIVNAAVREVILCQISFHSLTRTFIGTLGWYPWDLSLCQLLSHSYSHGSKWKGKKRGTI